MAKKPEQDEERRAAFTRILHALSVFLKKKKRAQSKARNEFRLNLDANHPNYIFEIDEARDEYRAIGLTHETDTFGKPNMPLKHNPKKGDPDRSYVRNGIIEDDHKNFSRKKLKNMQFSSEDMPNVKSKIRKYKTERRKKGKR